MLSLRENGGRVLKKVNSRFSRRDLLLAGGASALVVGGLAARPGELGAPMSEYFNNLSRALKSAGIATPRLIVDRSRFRQNIDALTGDLPQGLGYRVVSKSLPSFGLLDEVANRAGTNRMMAFGLEFLQILTARQIPYDILLGKPMPVLAATEFYNSLSGPHTATVKGIQWLVDTPRRITEYAELAAAKNINLYLNFEIDVGLHRGGFATAEDIIQALRLVKENKRLSFSGFMGYEPHLAAVPTTLGIRKRATQEAWKVYGAALNAAREVFGGEYEVNQITRNAGGSPTYRLYKDTAIANEISVGSALVKPMHFDTDMLVDYTPASYIAAPVIKTSDGLNIPHLGFINSLMQLWNPNKRKTVFIYGGHWYADPVSPKGLSYNGLFGRSSNQEMLNGSSKIKIQPDDYVFFRPHQSEAVFLQFGDIAVYENGAIADNWPVFPAAP